MRYAVIILTTLLTPACAPTGLPTDDACATTAGEVSDGFAAARLDQRCWERTLGTVSVDGGVLRVDGRAGGQNFAQLRTGGIGAGDFHLRALARVVAPTAQSSISLGWRGDGVDLAFLLPLRGQGRWHALVNAARTEMDNPVEVGEDYAELEIVRVGDAVTFIVNGAPIHSLAYPSSLDTFIVSANGDGALDVDAIALR